MPGGMAPPSYPGGPVPHYPMPGMGQTTPMNNLGNMLANLRGPMPGYGYGLGRLQAGNRMVGPNLLQR
jgi:hypothetical protein